MLAVASEEAQQPRSVSVAIRTVFLLPEEEGTVLGAPRGVSLCRDITNFAMCHITHDRGDPREPCTAMRATIRTK